MNVKDAEESLVKYHLLHFLVGVVAVFLVAFVPAAVLPPEFLHRPGLDRLLLALGTAAAIAGFIFLGKL